MKEGLFTPDQTFVCLDNIMRTLFCTEHFIRQNNCYLPVEADQQFSLLV